MAVGESWVSPLYGVIPRITGVEAPPPDQLFIAIVLQVLNFIDNNWVNLSDGDTMEITGNISDGITPLCGEVMPTSKENSHILDIHMHKE